MGTLKEQIDELTAKVIAKDGELAALTTAHDKTVADIGVLNVAAVAALNGKIEALTVELAAGKTALEAKGLETQKIAELLKAAEARAGSAESKLANPAFDHASAKGVAPLSEVNSENGIETPEQFQARYDAESDPVKKTLMWEARRKKMAQKKD